jgi:DNA-binding CsgD family transcriptional regulator
MGSDVTAYAELALSVAAVCVIIPSMAPGWLKEGDFSALPAQARLDALYMRVKYLQCMGKDEAMLAAAQTGLSLCASEQGVRLFELYLRLMCAVACYTLGRADEARRRLLEIMRLCLPHGFISLFAEYLTPLGGLVEQCLEQSFPEHYDAVLGLWKRTWKNWITFHNQFAKGNITLVLSLREYHIALLVSHRVPYAKIAQQHCISVGRVKNIMLDIYGKLCISGRDELSKYVF